MCFSMLIVSYETEKTKGQFKCDNEADERAKIEDVCNKDMPAKIEVFRCHRIIARKRVWDENVYIPPLDEAPAVKAA